MKNTFLICVQCLITLAMHAQVLTNDRDALMALYNATDGPNWTDNTNWGTSEPVEDWYGITVNANRVTRILLRSNELNGTIPPELGQLTALTSLNMYGNNLSESIPGELGNLSALTYLNLYNNELSDSIPPELGNLSALTYLRLSSNQLIGNIPPELGNLTALTYLGLQRNKLNGSIPSEIGNLTMLTTLYLSENNLSGSIPYELGNLTLLTDLFIYSNQLSGNIPPELGNLTSLTRLYMENNNLFGTIPPELGNLVLLERFRLNNNQLTGTIPSGLGNLSKLDFLSLHTNQIEGSIPPELGNLSLLEHLYLSNNRLNGSMPDISGLTNLQEFSIRHNFFTFDAIEKALSFPNIPSRFDYRHQYNFSLNKDTIRSKTGSDLQLDITSLSVVDLGGANNRYQWFKDGNSISSISASPVLNLESIGTDDFGTYTCEVTNTIATELTLTSDPLVLEKSNSDPAVANPIADINENEDFVSTTIDLSVAFTDADGDALSYSAISGNTGIVTVGVSGNILTITEVASGTTTITVTADDENGGRVDDVFSLTIDEITSVLPELTDQGVKIYPNPAKGIFYIETSKSDQVNSIKVIDMNGKTILDELLIQAHTKIDLSGQGKGMYFISILSSDEYVARRVLIE